MSKSFFYTQTALRQTLRWCACTGSPSVCFTISYFYFRNLSLCANLDWHACPPSFRFLRDSVSFFSSFYLIGLEIPFSIQWLWFDWDLTPPWVVSSLRINISFAKKGFLGFLHGFYKKYEYLSCTVISRYMTLFCFNKVLSRISSCFRNLYFSRMD